MVLYIMTSFLGLQELIADMLSDNRSNILNFIDIILVGQRLNE